MQFELPIFENLSPSWEKIAALGTRFAFSKGSQIFSLGAPVNGIYFVKEGVVEILLYTLHGPEKVLFFVGPGSIFGEVSCFVSGESQEASVRARSDCVVYYFSRELVEGVIASQHPHLLIELIQVMAHKIRMYGILLQDSLTSDHFIRVCKMLVYLVRFKDAGLAEGQKQVIIQPDLTQIDLARLMGIHRVTVSKAISHLKALGILRRFSRKELDIQDFPGLCQLVENSEL
jgi:CRP-like cAMP-binding protein